TVSSVPWRAWSTRADRSVPPPHNRSHSMLVMRPAQLSDLAEVKRLAADSPLGVTSLPDDVERLREKILASEASFAAEVIFNGEESYFFVLEDSSSGRLLGCSGLVASAGYSEPFYTFRNETFVHASR